MASPDNEERPPVPGASALGIVTPNNVEPDRIPRDRCPMACSGEGCTRECPDVPERSVEEVLRESVGERTIGGCRSCDAEQEVVELRPGIFSLTVLHADACPVLALARELST